MFGKLREKMSDNTTNKNEIIRVEKLVRNYGKSDMSREDEAICLHCLENRDMKKNIKN